MTNFLQIAVDLEDAGLIWRPEIGDEVLDREERSAISILIDTYGMTPVQLRDVYLWLPTVEQIVEQFEVRQAVLFHAGMEFGERSVGYKTVVHFPDGSIESMADSLRSAMGIALRNLLLSSNTSALH